MGFFISWWCYIWLSLVAYDDDPALVRLFVLFVLFGLVLLNLLTDLGVDIVLICLFMEVYLLLYDKWLCLIL